MDIPSVYNINVGHFDTFTMCSGAFATKILTTNDRRRANLLERAGRVPVAHLKEIASYVTLIYQGLPDLVRLPLIYIISTLHRSLHLGTHYLSGFVDQVVDLHRLHLTHGPVYGTFAEFGPYMPWLDDVENVRLPPNELNGGINLLVLSENGIGASVSPYTSGIIYGEEALLRVNGSYQTQDFSQMYMQVMQGLTRESGVEDKYASGEVCTFISSISPDDAALFIHALSPEFRNHHPAVQRLKRTQLAGHAYTLPKVREDVHSFAFFRPETREEGNRKMILFNYVDMERSEMEETTIHFHVGMPGGLIQKMICDSVNHLISISNQAQPRSDSISPSVNTRRLTCGLGGPGFLKSLVHFLFVKNGVMTSQIERYLFSSDLSGTDDNMLRGSVADNDILPFLMALINHALEKDMTIFTQNDIILKPLSTNDARAILVYLLSYRSLSRQLQLIILGAGPDDDRMRYRRTARDIMSHITSLSYDENLSNIFTHGRASFRALHDNEKGSSGNTHQKQMCLDIAMSFKPFKSDYTLIQTA